MGKYIWSLFLGVILIQNAGCNQNKSESSATSDTTLTEVDKFANIAFNGDTSTAGMVKIPSGTFMMGGDNEQADKDEYPKHKVSVDGFYMDENEVTNAQFRKFVEATDFLEQEHHK